MSDYRLSEEQKQHFLTHGFIKLEKCFSIEDKNCKTLMDRMWERLDMNPSDKDTWNPWRGKPTAVQKANSTLTVLSSPSSPLPRPYLYARLLS